MDDAGLLTQYIDRCEGVAVKSVEGGPLDDLKRERVEEQGGDWRGIGEGI